MCDESLIQWAAERAASLLSPSGNRWLHVQGVVERARQIIGPSLTAFSISSIGRVAVISMQETTHRYQTPVCM